MIVGSKVFPPKTLQIQPAPRKAVKMLDIAESPAPPTKGAVPSWSIPNAEEELEDGEDEKAV